MKLITIADGKIGAFWPAQRFRCKVSVRQPGFRPSRWLSFRPPPPGPTALKGSSSLHWYWRSYPRPEN